MKIGRVVVIGAGPAGLTAAYELAERGVRDIVVLEATGDIGGLSKTVNHRGNRIDIGGHRFFSKSDWVMEWWLKMLPLAIDGASQWPEMFDIAYQGKRRVLNARPSAAVTDEEVMLVRSRLSRIYFNGRFFDYPLKVNLETALKLGLGRCTLFALSYLYAMLFPRRPERTLEDFFINRFGYRLYLRFFKSYTEKVWGTTCDKISAEWGAQRVKSLSVLNALRHALRKFFHPAETPAKAQQTSLIERFLYPKYGPGLMWETTANRLRERGVRIEMRTPVHAIERVGEQVTAVRATGPDGKERRYEADQIVSTMPVRDLVLGLTPEPPSRVRDIAAALEYRDFITVGLLYRRMKDVASARGPLNIVPDNWIYIQEPGVQVGRLQVFNNWSPYMVADPDTVWIGMEYFCREGDELWTTGDEALRALGVAEMAKLRLADPADCLDAVVIRMPKAYPGYYGAYARFGEVRSYLDGLRNLFLIGRNGMHRYNNQDHSMLAAKCAVEAIIEGSADKSRIWAVNIDDEYHEEKSGGESADERFARQAG